MSKLIGERSEYGCTRRRAYNRVYPPREIQGAGCRPALGSRTTRRVYPTRTSFDPLTFREDWRMFKASDLGHVITSRTYFKGRSSIEKDENVHVVTEYVVITCSNSVHYHHHHHHHRVIVLRVLRWSDYDSCQRIQHAWETCKFNFAKNKGIQQ